MTNEKQIEEIYWEAHNIGLFNELQKHVENLKETNRDMKLHDRVNLAVTQLPELKERLSKIH